MKTASWFTPLPDDHIRIGISRGIPRGTISGFRMCRALRPGPWFSSVETDEYCRLYAEVLAKLDRRQVIEDLRRLAGDGTAVLVCFERPNTGRWCHRALAAEWLAEALGEPVPEFGHEHLPQHLHPLLPPEGRRVEQQLLLPIP